MNIEKKISALLESYIQESDRDPGLTAEERQNMIKSANNAKKADENRKLSDAEIEKADKEQPSQSPETGHGDPDLDGMTPDPQSHVPAFLLKAVSHHAEDSGLV